MNLKSLPSLLLRVILTVACAVRRMVDSVRVAEPEKHPLETRHVPVARLVFENMNARYEMKRNTFLTSIL